MAALADVVTVAYYLIMERCNHRGWKHTAFQVALSREIKQSVVRPSREGKCRTDSSLLPTKPEEI